MQVQQGQRKNPPVGQNLAQWNWEDREGWGQGISTGTGWSDSDSASHQSDGQEIDMWMNSSHRGFTSVASNSGNSDSKACDSHDKDPWPTDTDNASAKSGSVISSSSNPGQGQGSVNVNRGPNTITSSASSMWGSSFATSSNSRGAWDVKPGGGSGVWGDTPSAMSSSTGGEHDLFMQGDQVHSGGGDTAANPPPPYTSSGDTKSLGWANISQNSMLSQQQQPPQSCANTSDTSTTSVSGAVHVSGVQTVVDSSTAGGQQQPVGSGSSGGAVWQGMDLKTTAAATLAESSWGGVSTGDTVISSSLGMSESSSDVSNKGHLMPQRSGSMNQWDCGSDGVGSWGEKERKQSERPSSGWGSPVSSPLPNAGTEEWSRPDDGKSGNWGQAPGGQPPSGWTPQPDTKTNPAGWGGQVERPGAPGWGDSDPAKSTPHGWGQGEVEMARQPWGDKPPPPMQQMPWDVTVASGGNNPSAEWGSSQPPTSMSAPGAWGNSNPMATAGSNRPVGSQPPPPPMQQQQQQQQQQLQPGAPGTWAQAAGRGLPPTSDTTRPPPAVVPANMPNTGTTTAGVNTGSRLSKEDLIAQVVNSSEGWGKMPVRQDTAWNVDNSKQHIPPHKAVATGGMGVPEEDANHWHQPNNGTAIWEATKESGMPPPQQPPPPHWNSSHSGAAPSSDADAGTWNGPPSQQANMYPQSKPCPSNWQGPPGGNNWNSGAVNAPPMHNWSGSGASSSSSGSWDGNVKSDWGTDKKDDSVFNRDGTLMWGDHSGAKPGEIGSWGSHQQSVSGRSSTSGDGDPGEGWGVGGGPEPPCPPDVDDGTTFWGEPNTHQRPQSWNGPDGPPGPRPISGKMDDKGPSMWNQPPPPHPLHRPFSFGDCGGTVDGRPMPNQMNDAFWGPGGVQPKPGNWGDPSWMNIPKPHKGPGSWGDSGPDPHHWNMKRFPLPMNANFGSVNRQQQPQMRSRLIQQLMDMGFKKEDAQNALIRNNMNLESAIADLVASTAASRRPDMDFCDMPKIRQVRGMGSDSMGDIHMDNGGGHIMPPNTPFSNAQTQFMNSQAFVNSHKQQQQGPASLQTSSSLIVGGANSSINNPAVTMQQKLLQQQIANKKHQQPPPMPAQGQPIRGGGGSGSGGGQMPATTVQHLQQQQAQQQQQIVQQLHMAVTAGLISPQLLNQQMTPTMLVMLQQLLQLQQMLQQLVSRQQLQMQQPNKLQSRQQLDYTIQEIKQQIHRQQQQIAAAQQQQQQCLHQTVKQPPPMPPGPVDPLTKDLIKDLSALDMGGMNLKAMPGQQQTRSRLTQWKLPSPEKDVIAQIGGDITLNKVVGGKPLQQSQSTPNLQTKFESNLPPFFDSTWSSSMSSTSMWPTTSAMQSMTACSTSQAGELTDNMASSTSKESLVAGTSSVAATVATSDVTSSTASGTTSPCSESPTSGESLDIVEFFPGKKWQGVETKSIEDDPHMTPGSVSRSLSVNTVKEDYLMSMFGKSDPDSNSPSSAWSAFSMPPKNSRSKSSSAWQQSPTDPTAVSLSTDPWGSQPPQQGSTVPKNTRPPPGLAPASKTGSTWQHPFNRSQSWTPGERSLTSMGSAPVGGGGGGGGGGGTGWGSPQGSPTNWLVLKNLTPQIDGSTLKTLCMQHGPLQVFYLNQGMALVCYNTRQEAVKAQNALDSCILSNTTILAECISEPEMKQLLAQTPAGNGGAGGSTSALWPQQVSTSHPPSSSTSSFRTLAMPTIPTSKVSESGQWNGSTNLASVWSADGLWAPTEDDHTC